jgi:predicted acylesterase/phospholipase RssA
MSADAPTTSEPTKGAVPPRQAAAPAPSRPLGQPGAPLRALAFSGGAYTTAVQLGVAHALLVSRGREPDIVVGVSAGAINAVALAEILQARGSGSAGDKLAAQVSRFREILEAYRAAPSALFNALLPDAFEVSAKKPLAPAQLPIHAQQERRERQEATAAKAGLIRLANDLLGLRLTVTTCTRIARAVLGLQAAVEVRPRSAAALSFLRDSLRLWWTLATQIVTLAPMAQRVVAALVWQTRPIVRLTEVLAQTTRQGVLVGIVRWALGVETGSSAAVLIFRRDWRRRLFFVLRHSVGILAIAVTLVLAPFVGLLAVSRTLRAGLQRLSSRAVRRFFASYDVADGILDPHSLKDLLVRLFDPDYYGEIDIQGVVENALRDTAEQARKPASPKRLAAYSDGTHEPRIRVGPIATDVVTGRSRVLSEREPVVDALLAATAVPPFFEAVKLEDRYYVDARIVSNEPTPPLVEELASPGVVRGGVPVVHVYPVVSLPLSRTQLEEDDKESKEFTELVEIASRAMLLQQFRDATLDRRMTELYTSVIPPGQAVYHAPNGDGAQGFVRANVYPIEPAEPLRVNERILLAVNNDKRRQIILDTVASGCRSALEAMIQPSIQAARAKLAAGASSIACAQAIQQRIGLHTAPLPGSDPAVGPGVPEVCRSCVLNDRGATVGEVKQSLSTRERDANWPAWPAVGVPLAPVPGDVRRRDKVVKDECLLRMDESLQAFNHVEEGLPDWPFDRPAGEGSSRPLINLVFSGGVFRGVFLMGVVNALNELGLQPDVITGSSVGSISAAMTARVFSDTDPGRRRLAIADLAATFLAIDRIVLTDRFADFVRSMTLRAGEAGFSLRHLDSVFRTYDHNAPADFSRGVRCVLAGLERLLHVNPFDLHRLTKAVRRGERGRTLGLLREFAQNWLDRGGVGLELLGAEPLEMLIVQHVLGNHRRASDPSPRSTDIDLFLEKGIYFMATVTNLTVGRLEIMGAHQYRGPAFEAKLVDALLASSAFPAVFRPRWSWEVMPQCQQNHQYIDGGVMDNLPLDSVANFLHAAARAGLVCRRPRVGNQAVPHLVFTASLEVDPPPLDDDAVKDLVGSWRSVWDRATRLSYNRKLDAYEKMQRHLRLIQDATGSQGPDDPLDLEVVAVKPRWLCGTFAFHPMLGFRRRKQAASIAHGCASTLARFASLQAQPGKQAWMDAWGIKRESIAGLTSKPRDLTSKEQAAGACWFRPGATCPFSKRALSAAGMSSKLSSTIDSLDGIYRVCGKAATHEPAVA